MVGAAIGGCGSGARGSIPPDASGLPGKSVSPTAVAATPTPVSSATSQTLPIAVVMQGDNGTVGALGSYVMDGQGGDSPWLPIDTLTLLTADASTQIRVQFRDGAGIGAWVVDLAPEGDATGARARRVAERGGGPAVEQIVVGPLPPGRWVLAARLFRADGRGDGVTYWGVSVP
ncbi:MAG: hypothetical protein ABI598_02640 [Chloroflexota bacterium]